MTLGEKLQQSRQRCGLSQQQVAGSYMTRNMLSQLEHDLASPSVKTLRYLADTLHVSVGWLLDDAAACDLNCEKDRLRTLYREGAYLDCVRELAAMVPEPDEELRLLLFRSAAACAERSLSEGCVEDAERFVGVAGNCRGLYIESADTYALDLLRLRIKLEKGEPDPALMRTISEGCPIDRINALMARHELLQGCLLVEKQAYEEALPLLHRCETSGSLPTGELDKLYYLLECCYKEKEDYKQAYHYATLRMNGK